MKRLLEVWFGGELKEIGFRQGKRAHGSSYSPILRSFMISLH
jgi:hypothetical protein